MKITEYENSMGEAMVLVEYDNGSTWSGFKSVWEAEQAQAEQSGTLS